MEAWREQARCLLAAKVPPRDVIWTVPKQGEVELFDFDQPALLNEDPAEYSSRPVQPQYQVPKSFFQLAESVACHRSDRQWAVLYDVLWRITAGKDRNLLMNQTDDAVIDLQKMRSAIRRDIHKMRAFVRFRLVQAGEDEHYVSWFEPDHRIVRLNAAFFKKRFTGMKWSILTPDDCVHWDGKGLEYSEGVKKDQVPQDEDELEKYWLTYYRNIFNPARVKIKMMQSEMPKKYWKNLPEAEIIEELIHSSNDQVLEMMERHARAVKPVPEIAYLEKLRSLNSSEDAAPE